MSEKSQDILDAPTQSVPVRDFTPPASRMREDTIVVESDLVADRRQQAWRRVVYSHPARVFFVFLILLVAALSHGELFSGYVAYRAVYVGVVVGALTALLTSHYCFGPRVTALIFIVVGLAFGGVAVFPADSVFGVFPTFEVVEKMLRGTVLSWKDLLTVSTPVPDRSEMLVMPYISGYLQSFVALSLALRSRRYAWALVPVLLLSVSGILWGTKQAPFAIWIGVLGGFLALCIAVQGSSDLTDIRDQAAVHLLGEKNYGRSRSWGSAVVLLLVGAIAAASAQVYIAQPADGNRIVLRDYFDPPLDLREYPSPVSMFRAWNTRDAETMLFSVEGELPESRVRLATLDLYDGTVFRVRPAEAGDTHAAFRKVFPEFGEDLDSGDRRVVNVTFTVGVYNTNWLPVGDDVRSIVFSGERSEKLQDSLYYSKELNTAISTLPLQTGDRFTVEYRAPEVFSDTALETTPISRVPMPQDSHVPREIERLAAELTDGAEPGFDQVRTLAQKLSAQGFYSDGSDGASRPGHRYDRLTKFVTADYLIGNDEQYAPAMVLMLRSLGIPSRLVLGFISEHEGEETELHGHDVRMWVEVPFEGKGWVPFDPTPPKDQTLRTEVPQPKPQARPQVLQPPEPPEDPAELNVDELPDDDEKKEEERPSLTWLRVFVVGVGSALLLLLPFVLLAGLKAWRALRRRRHGSAEVRSVHAWDELVDRLTDLGLKVPSDRARIVQAQYIDEQVFGDSVEFKGVAFYPHSRERHVVESLAERVDEAVFSASAPTDRFANVTWKHMEDVLSSIRENLGWRRRLREKVVPSSLLSRWTRKDPVEKPSLSTIRKGGGRIPTMTTPADTSVVRKDVSDD